MQYQDLTAFSVQSDLDLRQQKVNESCLEFYVGIICPSIDQDETVYVLQTNHGCLSL